MRWIVIVAGVAVALIALGVVVASRAAPGDVLHPVRSAIQDVGLADYTLDDVDALEQEARDHVKRAEDAVAENRDVTLQEAGIALQLLIDAREMLEEVPPPDKAIRSAWIDGLERRATIAIGEVDDVVGGTTSD